MSNTVDELDRALLRYRFGIPYDITQKLGHVADPEHIKIKALLADSNIDARISELYVVRDILKHPNIETIDDSNGYHYRIKLTNIIENRITTLNASKKGGE